MRMLLLVAALIAAGLSPARAQGSWTAMHPAPLARTETVAVTLGGIVYEIGGEALGREDSPLMQAYDPATDSWRDLAPLPHGASHMGAAVLNGKIYVAGGFTANVHKGPVDGFYVYDPATDRWRTLAPLSSPRGSPGLAAVDGKIHIIGGRGADQKTIALHEVYDPATNRWSRAAGLPLARDHFGIVAVDGRIHVFGGRTGATVDNVTRHDVFDPATGRWQTAAPMPTARSSGAYTVYRGLILYAGGECKNAATHETFDENEAYDPSTDRWRTLATLPVGLHAFSAGTVGDVAYFLGGNHGCGGGGPSQAVLAFRLR